MGYRNEHRECRDFQKDHPCAAHRHVRYHYATALVTSLCAFLLLYGSALTSAAADKPPITIYTASWCGPCQQLKAELKLTNPSITAGMSRLPDGTPVRLIDYDKLPRNSRPERIPAVSLHGEPARNLGKIDEAAKKILAEVRRRKSENNANKGETKGEDPHGTRNQPPNITPTATPTPTGTPEVCPVCDGKGHTCQDDSCTRCDLCGGDGKLDPDPAPNSPDGSTPGGSEDGSSPGGDSGGEDPRGEEEDLGDDGGGGGGSGGGGGGSGGGGQDDMMKNMMLQELMKNNQQQQQRRQEQEQQRQQEELQRQQEQRRKEEELRRLQQQDPEAENQERQQNNSGENTQKVAPQASPKPTPDPASVAEQQRNKELFPTLSSF